MGYELGSKVLAGMVLGFTLAVAVSGLYGWLGPNSLMDKYMVVLWFIVPVWTAVIALSCVFRRAWQVWGVLLLANGVAFALLWAVRVWLQ